MTESPLSGDVKPGSLILPETHTGSLFRGPTVSVYFNRQQPFISQELSHYQAKVVITFDLAAGTLRQFIGGSWRSERIAGRSCFFVSRGVPHALHWEREAELIEIYYETNFFAEMPSEHVTALFSSETMAEVTDDPVIWCFAHAISSGCDNAPSISFITDIGTLIGKRLISCYKKPRVTQESPRLTGDQRLRLDAYIRANVGKKVRVPQMAAAVAMSVSHFSALCRSTTGRSPTNYLRECRLRQAHEMARSGNFRPSEIARACGFYDGSHLNREFRRFFGHSPGALLR